MIKSVKGYQNMLQNKAISALLLSLSLLSAKSLATDFEITPFVGQMSSSDLIMDTSDALSLSTGTNVGSGIAW